MKPDGTGGAGVEGCVASWPSRGPLLPPGGLRGQAATGAPTSGWEGAGCLAPRRTPEQEAAAAALSPSWAPEGARGDAPRLHPHSWFKLVWAGCGPGGLHSRPRACRLPQGHPQAPVRGRGGCLKIHLLCLKSLIRPPTGVPGYSQPD